MKKLLFLFTTLLFISCSSEDDNETSEPKTFLEKNDGLGFYDDDGLYIFFYNDDVFQKNVDIGEPTENNPDEENFCVEIREGVNNIYGETENVVILTNDLEKLVVKYFRNFGGEEYIETVEYVVNPTQNAMTSEWYYGEEMEYTETNTFFKTTKTYSSLCN